MVGGFCVERSHAARRHAQRCGAPKAPLKGELAARNALTWVRLQERAARLAKSNPYSVEGLLQRKSKFAKQYSTPPGFKNKLENLYKPMSTRQTN